MRAPIVLVLALTVCAYARAPLIVENSDGTLTVQRKAEGGKARGLVITPQVVKPQIARPTSARQEDWER